MRSAPASKEVGDSVMKTKIVILALSLMAAPVFAQNEIPTQTPNETQSEIQNQPEMIEQESVILESEVYSAPEEDRPEQPASRKAEEPHPVAETPAAGSAGFRKPPGPPEGGILKVPHPGSAKGLLRINKDGTYQYKTPVLEKSQSASFRVGYQSTPLIRSVRGVSFTDMYGSGLYGIVGDYEWMPFRRFGALGIQLGSGLIMARGNGRFADGSLAEETYGMFVIPATVNLVYRFEYVRRQWAVPFVFGGGSVYGLAEVRDDGKTPTLAMSPTANGGGGIHLNVSRWDTASSFLLSKEYGIADLWLTVEARAVQGLDAELDMTNQSVSVGITVDY